MKNNLIIPHIMKFKKHWIVSIFIGVLSLNCSKLIEIDPPFTSINGDNVFDNDATAIAAVTDVLSRMSGSAFSTGATISNISVYASVSADELGMFSANNSRYNVFYSNSLTNTSDFGVWINTYNLIFALNACLDGLNKSSSLTGAIKTQLIGETKFLRGFCYFYLTNLYGDIPLVLSTNPSATLGLPRANSEKVYAQIIDDLKDSKEKLSKNYLGRDLQSVTKERVRPTFWAACALLARIYLYHKDYSLSIESATEVIGSNINYQLDSLNDVFLANSSESIWQLQGIRKTGGNTNEGNIFILPSEGPSDNSFPVYLSTFLLNHFEVNDRRRENWVDSVIVDAKVYYYAYKYKSGIATPNGQVTEYETVLRLGEQYLIRSEAYAQLGYIQSAIDDLNSIRKRAGLPQIESTSKDVLLAIILHERQVELFTEWGHRWFDLKRTETIDSVMKSVTPQKGGNWSSYRSLWPIALSELQLAPQLIQNPGY